MFVKIGDQAIIRTSEIVAAAVEGLFLKVTLRENPIVQSYSFYTRETAAEVYKQIVAALERQA